MYDVHKVTAAVIKNTKNGHELYNLQFDDLFWATKFIPLSETDRRLEPLYNLFVKNNRNLDFLIGRYLAVRFEDSSFGKNFNGIKSFDALVDFKNIINEFNGRAFISKVNVYGFLKRMGYSLNADASITLKGPYSSLNINSSDGGTICYPNRLDEESLTLENIGLVYERFFKGVFIDNGNPDRDEQYAMTPVAIIINRKIYHKSQSKVLSRENFDVLRVGDRLSEEQRNYLAVEFRRTKSL